MSKLFSSGISPFLDCNFGVNGQQGYVELEVCNMAKAISRTAIVSSSMERRKEPVHRVRYSSKCNTLRQGCKLVGSQTVLDNIFLTIRYSFFFFFGAKIVPFLFTLLYHQLRECYCSKTRREFIGKLTSSSLEVLLMYCFSSKTII